MKKDIQEILDEKVKGAIMRSRVDWHLYGEKMSSYFFKLEKYNFTMKNRYRLVKNDGEITINPKDILQEQFQFYKELFREKPIRQDFETLFKNLPGPKLTETDREMLSKEITKEEIVKAIKQMEFNKVPGPDGIPIDFIVFAWNKLEKIVIETVKEMSKKGPTLDESRGIISLINKLEKNLLHIQNWRPLSLLNSDMKIFFKILANRMYEVLPRLIHHDQCGFMKNRNISQNLLDLTAVIEHCEKADVAGLLVAIDFEKAYDTVNWKFLFETMRWFEFPQEYIQMVKNLLVGATSCTINNGWSSDYLTVQQGLRQGDCYSPPAFLLIIEVLGIIIRENEKIEGIQIGHNKKKHAQFADDLWAALQAKEKVLSELFDSIEFYGEFSGLKINYNKTQIMRMGSLRESDAMFITQKAMSWSRRVKVLGITFKTNKEEMCEINYDKLIQKVCKITETWQNHQLTLIGKVLVVNTLIMSQLMYCLQNTYGPS